MMRRIWIFLTKGRAENNKLTAALYFVMYKKYVDCWTPPLPPLGITRVEAAEGETTPSVVSIGRIDACGIYSQTIGSSD